MFGRALTQRRQRLPSVHRLFLPSYSLSKLCGSVIRNGQRSCPFRYALSPAGPRAPARLRLAAAAYGLRPPAWPLSNHPCTMHVRPSRRRRERSLLGAVSPLWIWPTRRISAITPFYSRSRCFRIRYDTHQDGPLLFPWLCWSSAHLSCFRSAYRIFYCR